VCRAGEDQGWVRPRREDAGQGKKKLDTVGGGRSGLGETSKGRCRAGQERFDTVGGAQYNAKKQNPRWNCFQRGLGLTPPPRNRRRN